MIIFLLRMPFILTSQNRPEGRRPATAAVTAHDAASPAWAYPGRAGEAFCCLPTAHLAGVTENAFNHND
jgi:hypothetical protein